MIIKSQAGADRLRPGIIKSGLIESVAYHSLYNLILYLG
ncbi:MAG: hypothetical protein OP8BY_0553 [Candidatus Saccharicenans subterraneus]|uniref:Uncharacterized protein n=1 Tax=Candidatus Saccharicenans subterraneus TaxID=2508984 RepID=A0A3E2BKJ4_9BACT|nr:MAG: hypothetical protein OP8BY_0553 [Candidatus Saccharicenans subterraneum]